MAIKDIIIKRKISKRKRDVQFFNYDSANSVGILYNIDEKTDHERIKNYITELSGRVKDIQALGFVKKPEDIGTKYFGQGKQNYFSEKHITKTGNIKEICVNEFIDANLDILVNLSYTNNFYVEYAFALSKAKFKVSGIIDCKYSDLNINYDRNKGLDFFISQVDHYLNTIKKA